MFRLRTSGHTGRFALGLVLAFSGASVPAQTADPSAIPSNPATTAPPAKNGTFSVAQDEILAAPGLPVPNGNLPWALDEIGGKSVLIPVHHSSVTEPPDTANATAGFTHTLGGTRAHTALHSARPVFFIHAADRTENAGDGGHGNPTGWALVPASLQGKERRIPHIRFSQISEATACASPVLCLNAESLPDGWIRLSPRVALQPGEYALVPVSRQPPPGVVVVYDFRVDPSAPLARDAVLPSNAGAPASKHRKK